MHTQRLESYFCMHIPKFLKPGLLYVSMEYATAAHSCCCGCGEEVVTPFTPTDWEMTFNGETISLWPSIGNWTLPCRSHYVVRKGVVFKAGSWTDKQILVERQRDRDAKQGYYESLSKSTLGKDELNDTKENSYGQSLWQRVRNWTTKRIGKN